jgi:flagellar FliJ protein
VNQAQQSLDTVIELAERRRDEALAALSRAQRDIQAAQAPAWLMHHREFMAKIHHAIDFQSNVLAQKQQQIVAAQNAVHGAEREVATLRQYAARQQEALQQRLMRREQKQTDEMAQNAHRRRAAADSQFQSLTS